MQIRHKFSYIESFDTIRGFGALLVMMLHGSYGHLKGGWIGVDLFFSLSGFLITSLLLKEYQENNNISFGKFYIRRALRLLPPLFICVIISNLLWPLTILPQGANRTLASAGALFYFTNILDANVAGNMVHLWSLCVEEHFYFLWPIVCFYLVFRMTQKKKILFLLSAFVVISILRIVVYHYEPVLTNHIFTINSNRFTLTKIDGILLGSLLAFISHDQNDLKKVLHKNWLPWVLLLIFFIILFTVSDMDSSYLGFGFILSNLLCSFTILVSIYNQDHRIYKSSIMNWLGKRSYGIYVYHFAIFLVLERLRLPTLSNLAVISFLRVVLSVGFAALSYTYVEKPILKLKKRYEVENVVHTAMPLNTNN